MLVAPQGAAASRLVPNRGNRALFRGGKSGIVIRMLADARNIFDVFKFVVRANDKDRAREHAIERAAGNQ